MPIYHATFFLSTPTHGWVEQLYRAAPNLGAALSFASALARARYSILGSGTVLHRVRVSEVGVPRGVATQDIIGTTLPLPSCLAQEVAEIRLDAGPSGKYFRSYALHGLPRGAILNPLGPGSWTPSIQTAALTYLRLLSQGWLMKIREDVGPELPLLGAAITSITERDLWGSPVDATNPPEGFTFLIFQANEPIIGSADRVQIRGVRIAPNLPDLRRAVNKTFPIVARVGTSVYVSGDFAGGQFVGAGTLQLQRTNYIPITSARLTRAGTRKAGPPTFDFAHPPVPGPAPVVIGLEPPPPGPAVPAPFGPPPPPPPPQVVISNALELVQQIYTSYASPTDPAGDYVQIAPVVEGSPGLSFEPGPPVYVVLVSGLDIHRADTLDQTWGVFGAYIGVIDPLQVIVERLIRDNTPDPCRLILAGHSMGGMQCEYLVNPTARIGSRQILNIVTFGSSAAQFLNLGRVHIARFACGSDPCCWCGPVGWWLYPRAILDFASMGAPEAVILVRELSGYGIFTHFSDVFGRDDQPYICHTSYNVQEALQHYNWAGYPMGDAISGPKLILGPVARFGPVPLPPH